MTEDKGILIKNIYYMLSYAFSSLRKGSYEYIAAEKFENVYDLFAEILRHGISMQLRQGLHKRYVEAADQLHTLRGRVRLNETLILRANARQRLACEFDEFSVDNIFNRILKSTIKLLLSSDEVKLERKKNIRKLLPYFSEVAETDLKLVAWGALRFDRNTLTYQMLLYLCYFVAQEFILTTDSGKYRSATFSDDRMCRLFEKFILEYFRKHHPELKPAAKQIEWNVIKEETNNDILPILQTDIFLQFPVRTLIIDAKYYGHGMQENFNKKTIHSHNQNQILTYVLNHDVDHSGTTDGMLLYAKTQEEIQPDGQMKWRDGNIIYYRTLDLNLPFDEIKRSLEAIVENFM